MRRWARIVVGCALLGALTACSGASSGGAAGTSSPTASSTPSPVAVNAPLAIWPETDRSVVPAELPQWRLSAQRTVTHFASAVLGYSAPVVQRTHSGSHEPSGERDFYVAPSSGSHRMLVSVRRVIDATHWSVIYLWGFGHHDHASSIEISKHHAFVSFAYWGRAASATVILRYGRNVARRTSTTHAQWSFPIGFPINVAGSVMVLFRNQAGEVYAGWGTALQSGFFAAG